MEKAASWFGAVKNPVDLAGGAREEDYQAVLEAALESPQVSGIILSTPKPESPTRQASQKP